MQIRILCVLQDNANEFLTLHNETSGALSDRAAIFTAGCVLAAMLHLILIVSFGRTAPVLVPIGQQATGSGYKTYENQMAERYNEQGQQPLPPPMSYPPV